MTTEIDIESGEWYWDRRTDKAYYAIEQDADTVRFLTVWHREEAADALSTGALEPLDSMNFDRPGGTFALKESFRTSISGESDREDESEREQGDREDEFPAERERE